MKLPVAPFLAVRYLTGKKSHSAVNAIAVVAICGVAVATAALLCVLSVFNGFSDLLSVRLDKLSPHLLVTPSSGKTFTDAENLSNRIRSVAGVEDVMPMLEDQALIIANMQELPVRLLGVEPTAYRRITAIDTLLLEGSKPLIKNPNEDGLKTALAAIGVVARTGLTLDNSPIMLFAPKRFGRFNPANPAAGFLTDSIDVCGIFQSEQSTYDNDAIITDIAIVRGLLMREDDEASSILISIKEGADLQQVKSEIRKFLPKDLNILDRQEQQTDNFRMIQVEKWMTYLLLFFIIIVASFNIISALSVLVIEKEGSMRTMRALGMSRNRIGSIFAWESIYVSIIGGVAGIVLGVTLVLLQQHFGLIKLNAPSETLIIASYPVRLKSADVLVTFIPILLTGALTALISYRFAKSRS